MKPYVAALLLRQALTDLRKAAGNGEPVVFADVQLAA